MVTQQDSTKEFSGVILDQLEELELFAEFVRENPSLVGLPHLELENTFLRERTNELAGETLPAIVVGGVGEENTAERNRLLHERLQMLKSERARDGRTVGEVLAGRTEFGGGFLFPAITDAFEADPSSNAALFAFAKQLFTSPVGIPSEARKRSIGFELGDLPAPVRVVVDAAQTTFSPGSLLLLAGAPALSVTGTAPGLGRVGVALESVAAAPGAAVRTEFLGNVVANALDEFGAPVPIQILSDLIVGLATGRISKAFGAIGDVTQSLSKRGRDDLLDLAVFLGEVGIQDLEAIARRHGPRVTEAAIDEAIRTGISPLTADVILATAEAFSSGEVLEIEAQSRFGSEDSPVLILLPTSVRSGDPQSELEIATRAASARQTENIETMSPLEIENEFLIDQIVALGGQEPVLDRDSLGRPVVFPQTLNLWLRVQLKDLQEKAREQLVSEAEERRQKLIAEAEEQRRIDEENAEITAPVVAQLDEAMRALQFDAAGRTAAERTTEFSFESGIVGAPVTQGSGPVFNTDAPHRLQAARDAAARAHQVSPQVLARVF